MCTEKKKSENECERLSKKKKECEGHVNKNESEEACEQDRPKKGKKEMAIIPKKTR